ncbi:uncharacterized protein ATC70_002851 [Mucor velutinosus]|uniref:Uncharacterized protein n=1 Tax=Mucor velutinosus TaxID=708070 RepID=A0AAN7I065_9FUNG|nr:hypothetical protein ATC70_002851 [Mucor velutinosus]
MGLHMHIPKFIKKTFAHKQTQDEDDKFTPANSVYSYYTSPAPSIVSSAFSRDPMRCGSHPDIVGYYYDPMGCRYSNNHGIDTTNTGA